MSLIKVGNASENSYTFELKGARHIVIHGKHSRKVITEEPMITMIDNKDWEELYAKYSPFMLKVKNGIIFALKNDRETMAKAEDPDLQEIETGTKKLKVKDLSKGVVVV